jgi:hypothetical protein
MVGRGVRRRYQFEQLSRQQPATPAQHRCVYNRAPFGAYLRVNGDRPQTQDFPGALRNIFSPFVGPYTLDTPWQSNTPLDWGKKQGINVTGGVTAMLAPGVDLILDGGVRRKFQQAQFFN